MLLTAWNGYRMHTYTGKVVPFNSECGLFRSTGGKWWLYYSVNHVTGWFKTKKAAMEWYNCGGR